MFAKIPNDFYMACTDKTTIKLSGRFSYAQDLESIMQFQFLHIKCDRLKDEWRSSRKFCKKKLHLHL